MQLSPVTLIILDGFGISKNSYGNAIHAAKLKHLPTLLTNAALLHAHGEHVGLPKNQMGNSEVGHLHIGSGAITEQAITSITKNLPLVIAKKFKHCTAKNVHILGMLSDGGVHGHLDHIISTIKNYPKNANFYIHGFADGRDVSPGSLPNYLQKLQPILNERIKLASISGRFYSMDRDANHTRTELVTAMLFNQKKCAFKNEHTSEEYMLPKQLEPFTINPDDIIIITNYREDRIKQLCEQILTFHDPSLVFTFTDYHPNQANVLFHNQLPKTSLGKEIAKANQPQLRIAETEKYAHVTYFFSGDKQRLHQEDRILIPSKKTLDYKMQAKAITHAIVSSQDNYAFVVANFANADMLGHTGDFNETVKAIEYLDLCIGKILACSKHRNICITADHGNAESMFDAHGGIQTAHSTNPVPFITNQNIQLANGSLIDIAPTILTMMGLNISKEFTGKSLIQLR